MRVLILSDRIPPEETGGAATIAWGLATGLRDAGHDVFAASATPQPSFEETRESIPTFHLRTRIPPRLAYYYSVSNPDINRPLGALIRRIQPDVVNAHNIQNALSFGALSVADREGVRVVWNSHDLSAICIGRMNHFIHPGDLSPNPAVDYRLPPFHDLRAARFHWNPLRVPLTRALIRDHTRARVSVSRAHAAALEANGIAPLRVVTNGIDVGRFETAKPQVVAALRDRLGLAGRRVILFAGRLRRDKGSLELIRALDVVARRRPDVALLLLSDVGFSAAKGRIRAEFGGLLDRHVVTSGWVGGDELVAGYHLADVVAVPSVYLDPFPTVNLEAMAAGKPVVATCFGGSREAVVDGETGFVVNPFDTATFAAKLELLLTDDALRKKMGAAGQRHARERFTRERFVADMLDVYREAMG
jgi:glycosyltransferase involved in cell wall biosynthesis